MIIKLLSKLPGLYMLIYIIKNKPKSHPIIYIRLSFRSKIVI